MKTKIFLTTFLAFIFNLLSSQVPQGFNYQAIARDGSGNILPNTPLQAMIYVQSLSTGGTIFWKELHSTITTNSFGLFTLVVGIGTRQTESSVATFNLIDWSITPKYLKTEIYYSGSWKDMGTSQLMSVPYAMTAGDLTGTIDKLAVKGTTSGLEDALFEVKNKDGQTVFAVYNEGVRVYVSDGAKAVKGGFAVGGFGTDKAESTKYLFVGKDSVRVYLDTNPLTKKLKGGFAVGGYDLTKGIVQDYLDVNSDSVRIYIDSNPATKKLKGGFAVGGYDMTKGTNTNYMNVNTDASGIINPGQNRVLWYPLKNAFLAGRVRIGTPDSVGVNSFATGYQSKARGMYSQAMGFKAIANGDYSTAIGKNAVANNINSFAFGDGSKVQTQDSYAFGAGAIANGIGSYAIGSAGRDTLGSLTGIMTMASGNYSFGIGQGAVASNTSTLALGFNTTASGKGSSAVGYNTTASGRYSLALGMYTIASGGNATAMGNMTVASGNDATAMGAESKALGASSTASGLYTKSLGWASVAMGCGTTAKAGLSFAMGLGSIASGYFSTAFGYYTIAKSLESFVIGQYNDTTCNLIPNGSDNWIDSDPLFIVGNGSSNASRSNALTVFKNGNAYLQGSLAIGTTASVTGLDVRNESRIGNFLFLTDAIELSYFGTGDRYTCIDFHGDNTYNDFGLRIARDPGVNANSGLYHRGTGSLILHTNEAAPITFYTANAQRMTIDAAGNVGIGTAYPTAKLEVNQINPSAWSGNLKALRILSPDNSYYLDVNTLIIAAGNTGYHFSPNGNTGLTISTPGYVGIGRNPTGNRLEVEGNASKTIAGSWLANSDVRIKMQIHDIENAQETLMKLHPIKFIYSEEWKKRNPSIQDKFYYNFIAQEFREVFPESVQGSGEYLEGQSEELLQLDSYNAQIVAIKALQEVILQNKEQQQQIESYKSENDNLKSQLQSLQKKVDKIEGLLAKAVDD